MYILNFILEVLVCNFLALKGRFEANWGDERLIKVLFR